MRKAALLAAALSTTATAAMASPGGFYLQEQAVRATGRAYSGEAADTGAASLWWNPAAIAASPGEVYVGAHGILVNTQVEDAGSTVTYPGGATFPAGGIPRSFDVINNGVVPNFAASMPIGERAAIGLSATAPFNFISKYDQRDWARYDAISTKLNTGDLQLTGAFAVTDWLHLGAGVSGQYAKATLISAYPNLSPALPDARSELEGDGWNWGWTVGAQARFDRLSLGASYRSAIEHELEGRVGVSGLLGPLAARNVEAPGVATFTTPWMVTLGARFRATDRLTLNAQVQRIGWGEFDAIRVRYDGGSQVLEQNYQDVTTAAVGADYALNDRVTLRGGVQYDPTPTRDDFRSARAPDADRWLVSGGVSFQPRENLTVDLAATWVNFQNSEIHHDRTFYEGTPAATRVSTRGEATGSGHILSAGMRWTF